jgi:outer membrane receptor for ferrienterochelin and colicins
MNKINYCLLLIVFTVFRCTTVSSQDSTHIQQLQEVVVTGQYYPQSLKNSVYKIKIISSEQIRMRASADVQGILSKELGIRFSTDYTLGESDISMMGLSGQNVKILLDGIPMADRSTTKQSLSQIDINSIEKIEMVEGPMSTVYGTDALAGVINIITKKIKGNDNLSIHLKMQEESAGNTYSPFTQAGIHNETAGINWNSKQWRLSGNVTRNSFGGYTDTAAYPAKVSKPKDQWMSSAIWGFQNSKFNVWYRLDYLNEKIYAAGVMNINTGKALDQYFITNRYTHQLQCDWQLKPFVKLNNAISFQDYKRNTETYNIDYVAGTKTASYGSGQWDVTYFKTLFWRSTVYWYVSPKLSLQPGIEFKKDETSGERIDGSPSISDYSLFVSAEIKPVTIFNIKPGLRFSKNSVYDAPPVIPSLSTRIALNKNLDFRFSYAKGFRAPVLRELYFSFHDSNHDIDGNPNLKAEVSNSFIGSLVWQKDSVHRASNISATVSVFFNDIHNRISLAQSGSSNLYTYINIDRYKSTGISFSTTADFDKLLITTGFSYIGYYNTYANDNTVTGNRSQFAWSPEVNANISYTIPNTGVQMGLFYKFTGALPSYQTSSNTVYISKIASYNWADFTISKNIFNCIIVQTGIKNIFNITKLQNSSVDGGGAHSTGGPVLTGYGRSFFAAFSFQWSKHQSSIKSKTSF